MEADLAVSRGGSCKIQLLYVLFLSYLTSIIPDSVRIAVSLHRRLHRFVQSSNRGMLDLVFFRLALVQRLASQRLLTNKLNLSKTKLFSSTPEAFFIKPRPCS